MAIKIKTKKDIVDQFTFFDENDGLYKLELKVRGFVSQEVIEDTTIEELAVVFNNLLQNLGRAAEDALEEKRVYFK